LTCFLSLTSRVNSLFSLVDRLGGCVTSCSLAGDAQQRR
jgi:hypothetical protein